MPGAINRKETIERIEREFNMPLKDVIEAHIHIKTYIETAQILGISKHVLEKFIRELHIKGPGQGSKARTPAGRERARNLPKQPPGATRRRIKQAQLKKAPSYGTIR